MFHIKHNITAGLALIVFFTSSAAFAAGDGFSTDSADTSKPAPKKQIKKKSAKAAPKADSAAQPSVAAQPAVAATPASDLSAAPVAAATPKVEAKAPAPQIAKAAEEDSAEAIKQRSGPGDPVAGKDKSELCQGCHGEEGNSTEPTAPKLAGQYGPYISKQLRNFQDGIRTHQIMSDIAKTINDDDLADIAAYFASRKKMKGAGSENKVGKELFLHGDMSRMMVACVNCHGVNGKGKTPINSVFPVIGGQHKDYLRGQIINFRAGDRSNSPGGVMNIITQRLTDAELEALADYVSGL
jgi:cytochrome c553